MIYTDLATVAAGDPLAIDNCQVPAGYTFCTATHITDQFIEVSHVQPGHDGIIFTKFRRITGRPGQSNSGDGHKRLVTAEYATEAADYNQAADAMRNESQAFKSALDKIAKGQWTAESVTVLRDLADRMEKSVA